jgi:hypothetical protein
VNAAGVKSRPAAVGYALAILAAPFRKFRGQSRIPAQAVEKLYDLEVITRIVNRETSVLFALVF